MMLKKLSLLTVVGFCMSMASCASDIKLKFRAEGKFKMVQFTDIHFGENEENDVMAQNLIRKVIELEQPDLAVVTGDVVSGYAWDGKTEGWYAKHYEKLAQALNGTYWAMTAGNHDT